MAFTGLELLNIAMAAHEFKEDKDKPWRQQALVERPLAEKEAKRLAEAGAEKPEEEWQAVIRRRQFKAYEDVAPRAAAYLREMDERNLRQREMLMRIEAALVAGKPGRALKILRGDK